MTTWLSRALQHPLTAGMAVDDPRTTQLRREIIRSKAFLRQLYNEWYTLIRQHIPAGEGMILELGSGAGFMKDCIPGLITSDLLNGEGIDRVLPGDGSLPFAPASLKALVMTDVLHHVADSRKLFREATRTIRPAGAVVMIEPWVTPWSQFVYTRFHPEPFHPNATTWEFPVVGSLSGANGALPWILFHRDRQRFEEEFPDWTITTVSPLMPFSYLLSGGVSLRSLAPGWAYQGCRRLERALDSAERGMAMFALIVLARKLTAGEGNDRPTQP